MLKLLVILFCFCFTLVFQSSFSLRNNVLGRNNHLECSKYYFREFCCLDTTSEFAKPRSTNKRKRGVIVQPMEALNLGAVIKTFINVFLNYEFGCWLGVCSSYISGQDSHCLKNCAPSSCNLIRKLKLFSEIVQQGRKSKDQ